MGVIHHPDVAFRIAIAFSSPATGASVPAPTSAGRTTFRVRVGDTLGTLRVVEINENNVVVEETATPGRLTAWSLPRPKGKGAAK